MTEPPPSFSDDELSSDLDGEVDAELHARIAADPAAVARQRELADAASRVGTPVTPLDPDRVDRLVATAMDRAVPAGSRRGPAPWLVAAVVVLLVGIGLTLVWSGRDGGSDRASTESTSADAEAGEMGLEDAPATTISPEAAEDAVDGSGPLASVDESESVASGAPTTSPFLGAFEDADALRSALATSLVPDADAVSRAGEVEAPFEEAFTRCADQLAFTLGIEAEPLASGYALVDDTLVLVYEWDHESFEDGRPTTLVTAVGRDACDEVALFER